MLIEFFGLPGVGKTHILNQLVCSYPEVEKYLIHEANSTAFGIVYDWLFYIRHPKLAFWSLKEDHKNEILIRMKRLARRKMKMSGYKSGILVDCGLMQPLLELYLFWKSENKSIRWDILFKGMITNRRYFLVTDSLEKNINREINRPAALFNYDENYLKEKYKNSICLLCGLNSQRVQEINISKYENIEVLAQDLYHKVTEII